VSRPFRVKISESAEKDFAKAYLHFMNRSPEEGEHFLNKFDIQILELAVEPLEQPLLKERQWLAGNYRQIEFEGYRTIFRVEQKVVHIVRILPPE
jgi:plasmid stabilization system protein ParE